jgi:hypothetical protein
MPSWRHAYTKKATGHWSLWTHRIAAPGRSSSARWAAGGWRMQSVYSTDLKREGSGREYCAARGRPRPAPAPPAAADRAGRQAVPQPPPLHAVVVAGRLPVPGLDQRALY